MVSESLAMRAVTPQRAPGRAAVSLGVCGGEHTLEAIVEVPEA